MSGCLLCSILAKDIGSKIYSDKNFIAKVNLSFDPNFENEIEYNSKEGKFYLKVTWKGCPKYDYVCIDMNGISNQVEVKYCPICGGKLSVNSLSRRYMFGG